MRSKINDVPCRVCDAQPGEPCRRGGVGKPLHGWHGGRVDDAARAQGLVGPDAPGVLRDRPDFGNPDSDPFIEQRGEVRE